MAATKGTSIVWGNSISALTGFTGVATGNHFYNMVNEDYEPSYEMEEIKNGSGETMGLYWYGGRKKLTLKVQPAASNTTNAVDTTAPNIGDKIIVTSADSKIAGTYILTTISQARKADGILEWDMEMQQWDGMDETVAFNS